MRVRMYARVCAVCVSLSLSFSLPLSLSVGCFVLAQTDQSQVPINQSTGLSTTCIAHEVLAHATLAEKVRRNQNQVGQF